MEWRLLRDLGEAERQEFLALARRRRFERNEVVCHEGDPADSFHLVASGLLAVRVSLPSGESTTINVLRAGDAFGELALLRADGRRTATIRALEPSESLVVAGSAFHQLRRRRPEVEGALASMLADRIDDLSHRLLEATYLGLDRRLYRRVAELAHASNAAAPVTLSITQAQLAELVGGTRQSVNTALQRLADRGIISLARGRLEVLDLDGLDARCAW